jgi:hypothetical protein
MSLEEGDDILITCDGQTIAGKLTMISKDGVSALLSFGKEIFAGHVGGIPVQRYDLARGVYRSIIDGTAVTFQKKPEAASPPPPARPRKRSV